jgi:hypothetical protein
MATVKTFKSQSEWDSENPILGSNEVGFNLADGNFKLGDGVRTWSALSYAEVDFRSIVAGPVLSNPTIVGGTALFETIFSDPAIAVIDHDTTKATAWYYLNTPPVNFTANFTNVTETNNRKLLLQLIIDNSTRSTNAGIIPLNFQINGTPVTTISWFESTAAPTLVPNGVSVITFTFLRYNDLWTGLAKLETFGRSVA